MFGYLLEHLENLRHVNRCKTCVSGMNALFWCTEVAKMDSHQMHAFYSIGPKVMFSYLLEHLENIWHVKRCKTYNSGMSTEVAKMVTHQMHPFYSIGLKMMFDCLLEQLENLRYVKRCKTCVSGMNAIFWCTEVAEMVSQQMHPFYSIGPKMLFGFLLERLENLRHVKRCKTCVLGMNAIFWCTEVAEILSNQMHPFYSIAPNVMFGCLLEHLETFGM
jgi:ribosomal protein L31